MQRLRDPGKISHILVTALVLSSSLVTLSYSDEGETCGINVTTPVNSTSIATVQCQAITISNEVGFNVDSGYDLVTLTFDAPYKFMRLGENVRAADRGELILVSARTEIELYDRNRTTKEVIAQFMTRIASTYTFRSLSDNNVILVLREAYSAKEVSRSMLCPNPDYNAQSVSATSLFTPGLDGRVILTRGLVVHAIDLEPFDLSSTPYDGLLEIRGA